MFLCLIDECGGYLRAEASDRLGFSLGWDNTDQEFWGGFGFGFRVGRLVVGGKLYYDEQRCAPMLAVSAGRKFY